MAASRLTLAVRVLNLLVVALSLWIVRAVRRLVARLLKFAEIRRDCRIHAAPVRQL
jgi:hypothetical protein